MLALLLARVPAQALPTVKTISGGYPLPPYSGYVSGDTYTEARYNTPVGLAIDQSGEFLFVADRENNAIRLIDFDLGDTADFGTTADWFTTVNGSPVTNLFSKPVGVAIDLSYNIFVLNRAKGTNGYILQFDPTGECIATNLSHITNANAIALDSNTNVYFTASNKVFKVAILTGTKSLVATISAPGSFLEGITVKRNGLLGVCDTGRNGILLINPGTGAISTNAGFHGQGDFLTTSDFAYSNGAAFYQPAGIAETGDGTMIVCDYGNSRVKAVLPNGIVTNLYGVSSTYWTANNFPGWSDGQVLLPDNRTPNVQSRQPNGVTYGYDGTIYVSEDYYHTIRKVTGAGLILLPPPPQPPPAPPTNLSASTNFGVITLTWTGSVGATNYNVKRAQTTNGPFTTIGTTTNTTFTDSTVPPGATRYYVVTALNAGGESVNSSIIGVTLPFLPVPDPQIGYLTFVPTFGSVFNPVQTSVTFDNDQIIIIEGAAGSTVHYNDSNTVDIASIPDPTATSGSTPPSGYTDGLSYSQAYPLRVEDPMPAISIKAIGIQTNHPNSGVVSAQFLFVAGTPHIIGGNAAQFTISDSTVGAHLLYTLDGTDPSLTNSSAVDLGYLTGTNTSWTVSFPIQSDTTFIVRAFKNNYQRSDPVTNTFTLTGFQPTTISFGFASGEGSSVFVASPGQTFYAPVTLNLVGSQPMYSLIFNLSVTNGVTNSGPPIPPGAYGFQSMLEKPIPSEPGLFEYIPPAAFVGYVSPTPILFDNSTDFSSLLLTNSSINTLGVEWAERLGQTNLYDTTKQTLITYSQAHDNTFNSSGGQVIVGGFNIVIPQTAQTNQTYRIQIGRPSATSDGIAAPVYIGAPTNNGTGGGSINALKYITVGQRKYIVGSIVKFNWFNAGDFGSSNIVDADIQQVFQSAVYGLNYPPAGSDLFDAMDSSGNLGALDSDSADPNFGYYTNANPGIGSTVNANPLFDGNDTTINQDVFGDGVLDVSDVYVTSRRAVFSNLTWYRRFWNNGQRVADTGAPNISVGGKAAVVATPKASGTLAAKGSGNSIPPLVNFSAGDAVGTAGQTVAVPITATIVGTYPLRVLMLNLTVTPLDGSPALTSQVSFSQIATVLGNPAKVLTLGGVGNYAAVWLNATNTGLSNSVVIGNLNVPIPSNASSNSAYAIHFDHASASPNGLASFPNHVLTGVLSTSSRTNSVYNDGIPDSWRLRWFGTTNNALSISNACPSGDGVANWSKYVAGVDPNSAGDFPQTKTASPAPSGYNAAIHWPTVNGKKYAIERSSSLFAGPWSILTTNTGTGNDMEYDDNNTNKVRFYRVRILP